jgi:uncharacterized protein YbbC (DUF1343 family)
MRWLMAILLGWLTLPTDRLNAQVRLGSEVLAAGGFRELQGKRVGLITNPSGVNRAGTTTIELLRQAPGVKLAALFGPEHGLSGDVRAGEAVVPQVDRRTGLPVHSLYGATRKPTPAMLKGLDALVYDLQDNGCRSYTFISTLGLAMEACAEANLEFIVLDRPNPLGGERVEGPVVQDRFRSFVSQWRIPYVYGLTAGELARMINGEGWIAKPCRLTVIPLQGWRRAMVWPDTGLRWVGTSPNIRTFEAVLGYPATGLFGEVAGGSGLTIGGLFQRPFQCVAAPWLDAEKLSQRLNRYGLRGVTSRPLVTTVRDTKYQGVEFVFAEPNLAPLVPINFYLLEAIRQTTGRDLYSEAVRRGKSFELFDKLVGAEAPRRSLKTQAPAAEIVRAWLPDEAAFRSRRQPYLLYGGAPSPRPAMTSTPAVKSTPTAMPPSAPAPAPAGPYHRVKVRRGDSLAKIASDLGVSVSDIVEANPGMDADRIKVGQELNVPRRKRL